MNLESRLSKLEKTLYSTQAIAAITNSHSDKVLLSTGEMVSKTDLSRYPNLVLLSLDEHLEVIRGNSKDVDSTDVARLIVEWRGSLTDVTKAF